MFYCMFYFTCDRSLTHSSAECLQIVDKIGAWLIQLALCWRARV